MSVTGKLRNAYNAIRDRLEADTDFNNYFACIDYDVKTENDQFPYIKIDFGNFTTVPSQIQNIEAPSFILDVEIKVNADDDDRIAETLLNAIEVFVNAFYGTTDDPTFGNYVLNSEIVFERGEVEEEDPRNTIVADGEVTVTLQHYEHGTL